MCRLSSGLDSNSIPLRWGEIHPASRSAETSVANCDHTPLAMGRPSGLKSALRKARFLGSTVRGLRPVCESSNVKAGSPAHVTIPPMTQIGSDQGAGLVSATRVGRHVLPRVPRAPRWVLGLLLNREIRRVRGREGYRTGYGEAITARKAGWTAPFGIRGSCQWPGVREFCRSMR